MDSVASYFTFHSITDCADYFIYTGIFCVVKVNRSLFKRDSRVKNIHIFLRGGAVWSGTETNETVKRY